MESGTFASMSGEGGVFPYLYEGKMPFTKLSLDGQDMSTFLELINDPELRRMAPLKVGAIANDLPGAEMALRCGADAIAPVRSEYFLSKEGKAALLEAVTTKGQTQSDAIVRMEKDMREQYTQLFTLAAKAHKPVTIRLLDAPLHKLLHRSSDDHDGIKHDMPHLNESQITELCGAHGIRLGLQNPEIYKAQLRAIMSAGENVPECQYQICIPYLSVPEEMEKFEQIILRPLGHSLNQEKPFCISTMIETPSAAIGADMLARYVTKGLIGMGDLGTTVFADPKPAYLQTILKANTANREGVMHPILKRTAEMALTGLSQGDNTLIWHGPVNYYVVDAIKNLKPPPDQLTVRPDQVMETRLQVLRQGLFNPTQHVSRQ